MGNPALLAAPIADFKRELKRLDVPTPAFHALVFTNDPMAETTRLDLGDLIDALAKAKTSEPAAIVQRYAVESAKLARFRGYGERPDFRSELRGPEATDPPQPTLGDYNIQIPAGLPGEFADYFRGALAWYAGDTNGARARWEELLARSADERHFRSVRAAYMLGRAWQDENPAKAATYYRKAQQLAASGFADSFGQASAGRGWEAHLVLKNGDLLKAAGMYLDQLAAGDPTAADSLRIIAKRALGNDDDTLARIAADPRVRRVVTAYLISQPKNSYFREAPEVQPAEGPVSRWLAAVETANVRDVESAEQLALAAYDAGQWDLAQRWVLRASTTPTSRWLQAKLLLRAGKVNEAAELLTFVVPMFCVETDTNNPPPPEFKDGLHMNDESYFEYQVHASNEVLAELGVLRLGRREYVEALDALVRSGFWRDASYIAERVLTVDELKNYVDRNWSKETPDTSTAANSRWWSGGDPGANLTGLLARRLARMERNAEAREYFREDLRANFDALVSSLKTGRDESLPAEQRAAALFSAAKITRTNGAQFFGTEFDQDSPINSNDRATNTNFSLFPASEDEVARAHAACEEASLRLTCRYLAASFGWEAAKLMPNDSDETARVLCISGSWIKYLDPDKADVFYKALVRRCRKTDIGDLADRMRWFPVLDENGSIVPWKPAPLTSSELDINETENGPVAGYWYVITKGNSWREVAAQARLDHNIVITVNELLDANPVTRTYTPRIGQKIFVPMPRPENLEELIRE